jgi:hypothetical protein
MAKHFIANVSAERNPLMMNPPRIHLISEIPDPAAYGAKDLTKKAEEKENNACLSALRLSPIPHGQAALKA